MEGLQLIDLGNEVSYIDIDTSKVPYKFSVKLDDRTFTFCIRYNEQGGFFTADLSVTSTGEVLVYGDIIRYGRPLFNTVEDERFPGGFEEGGLDGVEAHRLRRLLEDHRENRDYLHLRLQRQKRPLFLEFHNR